MLSESFLKDHPIANEKSRMTFERKSYKVASPGEYLSSGLNVLTTMHIGNYSQKMQEENIGILLDDIYDDNEVLEKVGNFKSNISKEELSKWASDNFSVQAYKDRYIGALKSV